MGEDLQFFESYELLVKNQPESVFRMKKVFWARSCRLSSPDQLRQSSSKQAVNFAEYREEEESRDFSGESAEVAERRVHRPGVWIQVIWNRQTASIFVERCYIYRYKLHILRVGDTKILNCFICKDLILVVEVDSLKK